LFERNIALAPLSCVFTNIQLRVKSDGLVWQSAGHFRATEASATSKGDSSPKVARASDARVTANAATIRFEDAGLLVSQRHKTFLLS
jgi:hypothetical protein